MLKYTSIQFQRNLRFANRTIFEQVTTFGSFWNYLLKRPAVENSYDDRTLLYMSYRSKPLPSDSSSCRKKVMYSPEVQELMARLDLVRLCGGRGLARHLVPPRTSREAWDDEASMIDKSPFGKLPVCVEIWALCSVIIGLWVVTVPALWL
jgi:hypothetical protein